MSDDWQPGDLALCVRDYRGPDSVPTEWSVRVGGVYTVEVYDPFNGGYLELVEDPDKFSPDGAAWDADSFRKIRPHQPDAEDAETIRLLNGVHA
jgi:hypothetical protein